MITSYATHPQKDYSALFRLWQQHRLIIEFHPSSPLIEQLVLRAQLEMDQLKSAEVDEVLDLFNTLAGTNYQLEDVLKHVMLKHTAAEQQGHLEIKVQRLWWLDFGDVDFPVYAIHQEEAERITAILEQSREKPRLSLTLVEQRREDYAPLLIICSFVVARVSKAE